MDDQKRSQVLDDYSQSGLGASATNNSSNHTTHINKLEKDDVKSNTTLTPSPKGTKTSKKTLGIPAYAWTSKRLLIIGSLAALLLLGSLGFSAWNYYVSTTTLAVTAFHVGKQSPVNQYIGGGGIVFPKQQLDLSYPVAERVVDVLVRAGDSIKPDQPLIKLDPTQLNAQVNQASDNVAAAQAYLNSVSNAFPYNAVTVAAAQQALTLAQDRYHALIGQASSTTLHNGNLISPVSGVVTVVNINPGEVFAANALLLTIMDQSTVTVHAKIPLSNLGQLAIGMPAQVSPSALPDVVMPGKIVSVIPQADPQTDTFEAWVAIDNPQQKILPGMSAFVRVQGQQQAFALPRLAVLNPDHESVVFIIRNGHAFLQNVHVTGRSSNTVYVSAGLNANDSIVLLPLDKVHNGQPVHVTVVNR